MFQLGMCLDAVVFDAALLSEGWHRCQPGGMLFAQLLDWLAFLEIGSLVGYLPLPIGVMGDCSQK